MSPRSPGAPANAVDGVKYAAHEAKRTADLLPYVQKPVDTLTEAIETITRSTARDQVKQAMLLAAIHDATEQLSAARKIAAEYSVLRGTSIAMVASHLQMSPTRIGEYYHSPTPLADVAESDD